jgi:hypothetical protein
MIAELEASFAELKITIPENLHKAFPHLNHISVRSLLNEEAESSIPSSVAVD